MKQAPPELPGSPTGESPLDRSLALSIAGERESALRWSAASVEHDSSPSGLLLTCRLLADMGRQETAVEGLELAVKRAIDSGNLPLGVAAIWDLQKLGRPVDAQFEAVAEAFAAGSSRIAQSIPPPPPLPAADQFQPLSSFLSGPALLSKATSIIHEAKQQFDNVPSPMIAPVPLFSDIEKPALVALLRSFSVMTVQSGDLVVSEGHEGAEAYIVARGELEVFRTPTPEEEPLTLARLGNGALFGEMALISRAPRAASVVACRPSILLVAKRDALEKVAERHPEVGVELAAHCRQRMVQNLVRTSRALSAVPPDERPYLVDRFETKYYEKGDRLIVAGNETVGLHLIASGEVAVVGSEGGESIVIAKLGVGDVVGEIALVLRRRSTANVVAVHPTVTLFLPREDFLGIVREHPSILQSLYLMAIERDEETSLLTQNSTTNISADELIFV